ncbi:aspartyl protease family protein 1 isoform X2 [Ricinus communis]|uniref:aspartyl protease family protein 1 isoform X2 n=1 Tax=Ricinus communis TaxID=3988 RepID=UPI000772746B|nr:aspartyl protease family protein 1 isoform X2 [Ricinus communis]|eukprot:XP_015583790.1 aspartyl protease family protein 1 isoform X2 [Ricinus communis]
MHIFLGLITIMFSFLKFLVFSLLLSVWVFPQNCKGRIFTFKMHHRFSDMLKDLSDSTTSRNFPSKGSFEYYAELAHRDQMLRGRKLYNVEAPLAFSDGNSTFRISSLGFLHYTTVELGTPGMKFMVALDTGSDLFWVPCDCSKCAPTQGVAYASDFELSIYDPKQSSTSKKVTCNNNLCAHRNRCLGTFSSCPYMVSYVSAQTSTSGILVEDVLHLTSEDSNQESIKAYVTFGCGQVQSGSFLNTAAPNGLFGLGMDQISVPSILSREGLTADSFSMCFGHDGVGRISFGDKGSPDQEETPFNSNPSHPSYNISVTQVRVGTTLVDVDFTALFDSGTSFTYLINPIYAMVSENFHAQAQDKRRPPDPRIPFEYCYDMSPGANSSLIPSMSLTMKGRGHFTVFDPIIVITTQNELVYCLAIVKSTELNIIGQNFMTGYRVVFDREKLVLGWKETDCYDQEYNSFPTEPHASDVPPAVAAGLGNYSSPHSTNQDRKKSQSSVASSYPCSHTCSVICFTFVFTLYILL